jgi:biopolymer transport protein ExbB
MLTGAADEPDRAEHPLHHLGPVSRETTGMTQHRDDVLSDGSDQVTAAARRLGAWASAWYFRTPPADRVTWGAMIASAGLGVMVLLERMARLRRRKIVPPAFTARFLDRLHDGKLNCGQALDHCELNPSPAARVALAAVRRWGRPAADLERAVALAHRVETEQLRRNIGTLRRIAVLTPLVGLLGTLFAVGRVLEAAPALVASGAAPGVSASAAVAAPAASWAPFLAGALVPLSTGIVVAILALVAYDGLLIRVEKLAAELDRLGAETIDAIAMAAPFSSPTLLLAPSAPSSTGLKPEPRTSAAVTPARAPHQSYFRQDESTDLGRRLSKPESGF